MNDESMTGQKRPTVSKEEIERGRLEVQLDILTFIKDGGTLEQLQKKLHDSLNKAIESLSKSIRT
jgi:hypothetical protein